MGKKARGRSNKNEASPQKSIERSGTGPSNAEGQILPSKMTAAEIAKLVEAGKPGKHNPMSVVQKANQKMGKEAKPLPVTVLSGFLGAGKTTMLTHLLQNRAGVRIAVVVNDMASVNVDADLVKQGGVLKQEEKMIELSNGCICCTLREDLLSSLAALAEEQRFDHVLVESSGISEPLPVAETFTFADEQTGASLSDVASLHNLVTVVDAASLLEQFASVESLADRGWEAAEGDTRTVAQLMVDQLEFADMLVVNKTDLLREEQLRTVEALLKRLNPKAEILQTQFGRVEPELLFSKVRFSMGQAEMHPHWLVEGRYEDHTPETVEYGISSFVFRAQRPFHPQRLHNALSTGPRSGSLGRLLRVKGSAWLATAPRGGKSSVMLGQVVLAGTQFSVEPMGLWWASTPKEELPEGLMQDITALWNEQQLKNQTEVVCIGQELDHAAVTDALAQCLLSDHEMTDGAVAWGLKADPLKDTTIEALFLAAETGNLQVVAFLVEKVKADVEAVAEDGSTALIAAASNGHLAVAKFLVEEGKANINATRRDGSTALMLAGLNGHLDVAKWLVEEGKADPGASKRDGWTALMAAALNGHLEVVKWLVEEAKANPNATKKDGWTSLMSATFNGHLETAKWLVKNTKADPNASKNDKMTVLMSAASNGHLEVAKWLVEEGKADPNAKTNDDMTALMLAAQNGHLEVARWLVEECKSDPNAEKKDGWTALMSAALNGHLEVAMWLVMEGKADPKSKKNDGWTTLMASTLNGHFELARWLVMEGKADPRATTNVGFTALMSAALNGHLDVARWLVEEGKADANAATNDGSTALMLAAEAGHTDMAKWLVEDGTADHMARTSDGMTAAIVAGRAGHRELAKWLMTC